MQSHDYNINCSDFYSLTYYDIPKSNREPTIAKDSRHGVIVDGAALLVGLTEPEPQAAPHLVVCWPVIGADEVLQLLVVLQFCHGLHIFVVCQSHALLHLKQENFVINNNIKDNISLG